MDPLHFICRLSSRTFNNNHKFLQMLVSQRDDHRKNFFRTRDLAKTLEHAIDATQPLHSFGPSLLRFYAAESGLKFLLNRVEKVPFDYEVKDQSLPLDTEAGFPGKVEGYSHDLPRMLTKGL
jgi:hypothetical protein